MNAAPRPAPAFSGAVLCGGSSRRMGRDKAQIVLAGRALAVRVADALNAAGARRVVAVGGDGAGLAALGLETVNDLYPGEGPLGGVLTAIDALAVRDPSGPELVAVLACDLVMPDPDAIRAVVERAVDPGVDVVVPVVGGRRHLHHAIWRASAVAALRSAFDAGERAPRRALAGLRVGEVTGIDPAALQDADDPEALAAAHDSLESARGALESARGALESPRGALESRGVGDGPQPLTP
jgi:molybdopterin-guanine dinucleotide biosynthesis protein A